MKTFVCQVCGHVAFDQAPVDCPVCGAARDEIIAAAHTANGVSPVDGAVGTTLTLALKRRRSAAVRAMGICLWTTIYTALC